MNILTNLDDDQLFDLLYISKLYTEKQFLKYGTARNMLNAHLPTNPQELRKAFKILSNNYSFFKGTPIFHLLRNTINGEYDRLMHTEIQNKLYNHLRIQFLLDDIHAIHIIHIVQIHVKD